MDHNWVDIVAQIEDHVASIGTLLVDLNIPEINADQAAILLDAHRHFKEFGEADVHRLRQAFEGT